MSGESKVADDGDMRTLDARVRMSVYRTFVDTARAPSVDEIATSVEASARDVRASLDRLAEARVLVLEPSTRAIRMAMPFSAVPTDVITRTHDRAYYAPCAWDALGIAAALHDNATIDATCPDCAEPIALAVHSGRVESSEPTVVAHFAVPPREWWQDIGFT